MYVKRVVVKGTSYDESLYTSQLSVEQAYWYMRSIMNSGLLCRDSYKAAYEFCLSVKSNEGIQDPYWPVGSTCAPTLEEVED